MAAAFTLVALPAWAADHCIRQGATGSGTGVDWANACPSFTGACAPSAMVRGDVYYVADGSYGDLMLNAPASGALAITIRKATPSAHGVQAGWSDSFGDGQATFGSVALTTDAWTLDGAVRDEGDWSRGAAYGFRADAVVSNRMMFGGQCSDTVTVQFMNIDGGFTGVGSPPRPLYLGGFGPGPEACANWVIRRNYIHGAAETQLVGTLNTRIEYNYFGPTWGKEVIRGQGSTVQTTIRYNIFHNGCRDDHEPGSGCTAEVAFFANQGQTPDFEGVFLYGNVVRKTLRQHKTDATFLFQSNDCKIYNNTIVDDAPGGQGGLQCFTGSGSEIRNNLSYFPNGLPFSCGASLCDNNSLFASTPPPFVDLSAGDFRLRVPLSGTALPSPYAVDLRGVFRGIDGVWDRGAFEFSAAPAPAAPSGFRIVP